ncbi:MAG: dTDP-4-dehydrorhamnose 3,5-epimerase family protein [Microbacteriaceae bacterium]|nr:dTDP-4-dehydrorhamnose 3,5-epimerase family protein [Microbacteriaceae bacterium]
MQSRPLSIPGAIEFTPVTHADDRGLFYEHYRFEALEGAIGHRFAVRQGNTSVSRRGTVRGIHYALVPPGQAKYVTCLRGAALDFVVDLRVGSPAFGTWDSVRLDDVDRRSVYLAEGLGHCFVALEDDTVVSYLVSEVFNPQRELGVSPTDPEIGLSFPTGELLLSPKDLAAPTLAEAAERGMLPSYDECQAYEASLTEGSLA